MSNTEISETDIIKLLKVDYHQQRDLLDEGGVPTSFSDEVLKKTSRYSRWRAGIIGGLSIIGGLGAAFQINHLLANLKGMPLLADTSQISPAATLGLVLVMFIIGMAAWSQPNRH